MRNTAVYSLDPQINWKARLLAWGAEQPVAAFFDGNGHAGAWDCLVAAGAVETVRAGAGHAFPALKAFQAKTADWLFGTLAYDLKNEVERLSSHHYDGIGWPDLFFFRPETVAGIRGGKLELFCLNQPPAAVWAALEKTPPQVQNHPVPVQLRPRFAKKDYLETVAAIRRHIVDGDLYEMNLCQEFFAENADIDPPAVFARLNDTAKAPFAAFFRLHDQYLLSASPERFFKKTGNMLLSQPIKGTRRRGQTPEEDIRIRAELARSEKDRAENVMIVDLVRNDLARHCSPGTVQTPELFGIHTFETVHHMISTVCGELRPEAQPLDALRDAFPMGSMTGAPKVMAMELIERYEKTRRGLYSGAVGYFTPEGNFDFNVVIRSILYHELNKYVSVQVGGAIVYDSEAEAEYEECLVKAGAMLRALGARIDPTSAGQA